MLCIKTNRNRRIRTWSGLQRKQVIVSASNASGCVNNWDRDRGRQVELTALVLAVLSVIKLVVGYKRSLFQYSPLVFGEQ